jgi:quercetin dioxygenase-like cupin family protein
MISKNDNRPAVSASAAVKITLAAATTVLLAAAFLARGQARQTPAPNVPVGMERVLLTKGDLSVPGREVDAMRAELAPGGSTGRHTHPGDEVDYVIEGQIEITFDGQPPHELKAGDALIIPMGTVHIARNMGPTKAIISADFIVEKGKPLVTMAP